MLKSNSELSKTDTGTWFLFYFVWKIFRYSVVTKHFEFINKMLTSCIKILHTTDPSDMFVGLCLIQRILKFFYYVVIEVGKFQFSKESSTK